MSKQQMANYTLAIQADSGYESTTEGRCTAEQYGQAIAALHGTSPPPQQEQGELRRPVGEVVLERLGIGDAQVVRFQMYKEIPPVGTKFYTSPPAQQEQGELRRLHEANQAMLAALKAILEDIDSDHGTGYEYAKARAAIAKGEKT